MSFQLPRLYPILDTGACERRGLHAVAVGEAFLQAGVRILQFRHKQTWTEQVYQQARQVSLMAKEAGATFVINDRADFAALLGVGVHLGQEDLPPAAIRRVVGNGLVGFSTHNREQLLRGDREAVDYVALGPVYRTFSKENPSPSVGLQGLMDLRPLTRKPLVAIGGITFENASEVLAAGADSVAVIGALLPVHCEGVACIGTVITEWLQRLSVE